MLYDYTYYPALPFKSSAIITFDGIGDSLTVAGITATDVVTNDGTATLTAGTGTITATAGTAYNIRINDELVYPVTQETGKTGTVLESVSGTWPDATIITGAGGLVTFWGQRIADEDGILVDGEYNPITNYPNCVSNGAECDFKVVEAGDVPSDSWWLDSGSPVRRDHEDWLLRPNLSGKQLDKWEKLGPNDVCHITQTLLYKQGTLFTLGQYHQALRFAGDLDCGAGILEVLEDENGVVFTEINGKNYPVLVAPA